MSKQTSILSSDNHTHWSYAAEWGTSVSGVPRADACTCKTTWDETIHHMICHVTQSAGGSPRGAQAATRYVYVCIYIYICICICICICMYIYIYIYIYIIHAYTYVFPAPHGRASGGAALDALTWPEGTAMWCSYGQLPKTQVLFLFSGPCGF